MKLLGYHATINITQALPSDFNERIIDKEERYYQRKKVSWLFDPFGNHITYGVRINLDDTFDWDFFLYAPTEQESKEIGNAFLYKLQDKYIGLDGELSIHPLYLEYVDSVNLNLYEIIFPNSCPFRINFLKRLITYYQSPHKTINLSVFILWRKDDLTNSLDSKRFMLKIYVNVYPKSGDSTLDQTSVNSFLRYLTSGYPLDGYFYYEKVERKKVWVDILMCNVFPRREDFNLSPHQNVPREFLPHFIRFDNIDFTIPEELPILKPPILENRNLNNLPISRDDPNYIYLGKKRIDGVLTSEPAMLEIDALISHLLIFGKTRIGKSRLIKILIHELVRKRPEVGILMFNFSKPGLEKHYPMASVYKFPSEEFKVPYIIPSERMMISIKGTSEVFAACLGLKHIGPSIFSKVLQRCQLEYNEFPSNITDFFRCVDNFMKVQKWEPEYKTQIRTAFTRRISELFFRPNLENMLNLTEGNQSSLPKWFTEWKRGGVVILDLTDCLEEEQHLIGMLILQMIDTLIPLNRGDTDRLKYLVSFDEAHRALGKSYDRDPDSPEFILKNKTNSSFSIRINEHGARGICYLIADQTPNKLLDSAIDNAKNKIIFQLGFPNNQIFTGNTKERELLLTLWKRNALVITDRERYLMKTANDEEVEGIT